MSKLLVSKVKLPKVTQVTVTELGFKPETIHSTVYPLKFYPSTYSYLNFL